MIHCEPPLPLPSSPQELEERAQDYARKIMSGEIPAGKWVRAAVARDLRDRERAKKPGAAIRFNLNAAFKAVSFFRFLRHSKGRGFAGKPFLLSNWQLWATYVLMGWQRLDDSGAWVRRFKICYCEVARKNGKSTWAASIGLYLFLADNEPGAEVYVAATKRDQAKIVHSEAVRMVKASPALRKKVKVSRDNLCIEETASKFEPLGADADSTDGLNISGAIVDELHAHKNRAMWDVLDTATGARTQPLIFAITTAGSDEATVCGTVRKYAQDILSDVFDVDTFFALIYAIDEDDDFTDENIWIKANPNLGVSVNISDLKAKVETARNVLLARNATLRLHFNVWTKQKDLAIEMADWNACSDSVSVEKLDGRTCYAGLDLAKTSDLCAFVLLFPPEGWKGGFDSGDDGITEVIESAWDIVPYFWTTEYAMKTRTGNDRDHFQLWVEQGLIREFDGNVIDFDAVESEIIGICNKYTVLGLAYDPWNATASAQRLQKVGLNVKEFKQNVLNFNEPTKTLLEMIKKHQFRHGGHSVMKWMASNLEVWRDSNNNIRPVKPDMSMTSARIDGMVALIMALGLAISESAPQLDIRVF